jgi:hypothetical protein
MARQGASSSAILTGAGSLFAALAASACCWLPLVFLGVGVSATAVGTVTSVLEAWRPAFVGAGVLLLGTAWYFTYFRKGAVASAGKKDCCTPSSTSAAATQPGFLAFTDAPRCPPAHRDPPRAGHDMTGELPGEGP